MSFRLALREFGQAVLSASEADSELNWDELIDAFLSAGNSETGAGVESKCSYVFNKGKRMNETCGVSTKNPSGLCSKHNKSAKAKRPLLSLGEDLKAVEEETWEDLIIGEESDKDDALELDADLEDQEELDDEDDYEF